MSEGEICSVRNASECEGLACWLPSQSPEEGAAFLEWIAGTGSGTGVKFEQAGRRMPALRTEYKRQIESMMRELERRRAAGTAPDALARWAVEERRRIVRAVRARTGPLELLVYDLRDRKKYGPGGRTYENLARRMSQKANGASVSEMLIKGATTSNDGVSGAAIKGARYLKNGGRVILGFSLSLSAYTVLTAPEKELGRTLAREGGGMLGGFFGSGVAVGACVVFGIATGGWGMLACGAVGGVGGGAVGTWTADRLFYSADPGIDVQLMRDGRVDPKKLSRSIPESMCVGN